jgi:acyl dehydratase
MREFASPLELEGAIGQDLGPGPWVEVTQEMVNKFAEATGDFQWIHVDVERARNSPLGGTIAHGFLTLSLLPRLLADIYSVGGLASGLNYGSDKVRFTQPVPAGRRVRARAKLTKVETVDRGFRVFMQAVVDLEGSDRPACVAELITLLLPA